MSSARSEDALAAFPNLAVARLRLAPAPCEPVLILAHRPIISDMTEHLEPVLILDRTARVSNEAVKIGPRSRFVVELRAKIEGDLHHGHALQHQAIGGA